MPYLLGGLAGLGILAAATGSRKVLLAWVVLFGLLAVAGLADFWKWGYEYGHELDPTAAIKVPGMAYQPPVIGSKQLLNFRATSWPALGGLALMASVALGAAAVLLDRRRRPAAG
jgi:copper chaperone NosL